MSESSISSSAPVVKDYVGNPITAGVTVAYPVRRKSDMWMSELLVTQVDQSGPEPVLIGNATTGRATRVKSIKNCIVIPSKKDRLANAPA